MLRQLALAGIIGFAGSLVVAAWLFFVALPRTVEQRPETPAESAWDELYEARDAESLVNLERAQRIDTAISLEVAIIVGAAVALWIPFARLQLRNER